MDVPNNSKLLEKNEFDGIEKEKNILNRVMISLLKYCEVSL